MGHSQGLISDAKYMFSTFRLVRDILREISDGMNVLSNCQLLSKLLLWPIAIWAAYL